MDDELISDTCQVFVVASWNSRYRILFDPFEHGYANGSTNVLKDLNCVIGRPLVSVVLRVAVSELIL